MTSKLALFALIASVGILAPTAMATPVTYSTTTSELCIGASGCGVLSQTFNGLVTVTFSPLVSSVNSPSFGSFGTLVVSCVGGGTACGSVNLTGLNLYLNIVETAPGSGTGNIPVGQITGSISGTNSSGQINWANPSSTIITAGGTTVTYSVAQTTLNLSPASTNNGQTTIQAQITDTSATPEPTSLLLFGSGFLALGVLARKSPSLRGGPTAKGPRSRSPRTLDSPNRSATPPLNAKQKS